VNLEPLFTLFRIQNKTRALIFKMPSDHSWKRAIELDFSP